MILLIYLAAISLSLPRLLDPPLLLLLALLLLPPRRLLSYDYVLVMVVTRLL